ncbi:MAG: carboxypeptidase, partial [Myxococcota bacterium]
LEAYRLSTPKLADMPFEGRVQVTAGATIERRRARLPARSVRVATDQPLGDLAISLFEPAAPDSFFQWGFFLGCLQRTEYFDAYIMEPTARKMLEADPALKREFEAKLADDAKFAADPQARLDFFYRRSPYYDERYLLYPVLREP